MRKLTIVPAFLFIATICATVWAWDESVPPPVESPGVVKPAKPASDTTAQTEKKLRDTCQRLALTSEQDKVVDNLVLIFRAELEEAQKNPMKLLDDIRFKLAELKEVQHTLEEARKGTDKAKIEELTKKEAALKRELANTAPLRRAELNFYEGLEPALNASQKKQLERIRKRMDAAPEARVKPVQIFRVARELIKTNPNQSDRTTQEQKIDTIEQSFRQRMATERVMADGPPPSLIEELIRDVASVLTAEQREKFEEQIETPETPAK